jgi:hypothetical protein
MALVASGSSTLVGLGHSTTNALNEGYYSKTEQVCF